MTAYHYRHTVCFQETSLVGNVYFTNYLLWQGHCRELFLREHAPRTVERLSRGELAFLTRSASCDYQGDFGFAALDDVRVDMRLERFRGGRMELGFTYRHAERPDEVVARGRQEIHCKVPREGTWVPAPFPRELVRALLDFADTDELRSALADSLEFQRSG